ncbi:MAG: hypothetical protein HZA93_10250 [Verrucomicrobia bacterium]|nr:hypothetical protein [Verrucomicrobiota bacterium]
MSSLKRYPLFSTALAAITVVALGEGWMIYERWSTSRETATKLGQKTAELHNMANLAPAPTKEVAAAIEADLAKAQRALATMRGELTGRGPAAERMAAAKVPAARTDAFFDLATFVEKTREQAKKYDVEVRPEASRFGFATYANAGPEVDRIPPVFHQRLVAQYLLESLFEAKPRALLGVQRERTFTRKEREERDAAVAALNGAPIDATMTLPGSAEPEGPDFFELSPQVSARARDYLDTTAFRITFTGQTSALRTFLNRLAGFELPVLVREVEVDPAAGEEAAPAAGDDETPAQPAPAASVVLSAKPAAPKAPAKPATAAPIVAKPLSKFTVTVEYVVLVAPAPGAAEAKPSED